MSYYQELHRRITAAETFEECSDLFKESYEWMVDRSDNVKNHGSGFSFHFDIYDSLDRYAHKNAPWLRCLRKMTSLARTLVELNAVYHATQPWLKEEMFRRLFERKKVLVEIRSTVALRIISSVAEQLHNIKSAADVTRMIQVCGGDPIILKGFLPFFYTRLSTYNEVEKVVRRLYSYHGRFYTPGAWYEVVDETNSPLLSSQHSLWLLQALAVVRPSKEAA
jgi:hypothetical protein